MNKKERRFGKWVKKYGRETALDMETIAENDPKLFYSIKDDGMNLGYKSTIAGAIIGAVLGNCIILAIDVAKKKN